MTNIPRFPSGRTLPGASPCSDRPPCGGRESKFLAGILFVLVSCAVSYGAAPSSPAASDIGIGGDEVEPQTHVRFEGIPKDARVVSVSTHLTVDKAGPKGLNFFAVQVNFPNNTWAHGGPQVNSGAEKANWGGLVNRGGGSKDYKETNWQEDLQLIEYGIDKPNTVPWKWERKREYIVTIERGKQVQLPAGTNAHYKVTVPERTMWEWKLTIKPVELGHESFTSFLYDSADHISSFYVWNEAGYGSTAKDQHARWSLPTYRTEDSTEDKVPTGWKRF
ncbi:MAG: hypothetical protein P4L99_29260 [Chthoniobacter sp.]|nr:hypothetical protein [Chthoniobacter sp.]